MKAGFIGFGLIGKKRHEACKLNKSASVDNNG